MSDIQTAQILEKLDKFPIFYLRDLHYIYNCAGDHIDDGIPAYDVSKAKSLADLVSTWAGYEFSVVQRFGVLGVIAELRINKQYLDEITNIVSDIYERYNGVNKVGIGFFVDCQNVCINIFFNSDAAYMKKFTEKVLTTIVEALDEYIES